VSSAGSAVASTAAQAPAAARERAQGNPLAAGLIAFGAGWLVSSLLPASQKEQQAGMALKEVATEHSDKVTGPLQEAAQQVTENLREPAQQAAERVRTTATEAGEAVKEQAASAGDDVAQHARHAKDAVTDSGQEQGRSTGQSGSTPNAWST
jgi:hypothetical protein